MAPSRRRYSSDSSSAGSRSDDDQHRRRRRSTRDRPTNNNKKSSYSSSDGSSDSDRGRDKYRRSNDEPRRRRHDSDSDEKGRKEISRVPTRVDQNKKIKGYSSDKEVERKEASRVSSRADLGKSESNGYSSDEELERKEISRVSSRKDRRGREQRNKSDRRHDSDDEVAVRRRRDDDRRERSRKHEEPVRRIADDRKQEEERARQIADDRKRSRREEEDDSMEEGEMVDRKVEISEKREIERRAESPPRRERRHRDDDDDNTKKSRGRGRDLDKEDEKEVGWGDKRKRDRESSPPRRRDRDHTERNGNDYEHRSRHREQERSRGKDVKEESKKEPERDVTVPQMPDAGVIRTGGIYIPPHRMAQMMREVQDKSSEQYQRMSWDALKKSINGLVNKVNATNIKNIIPELFSENLIRGRGLFCRSCMKSQMASPGFTDVFAALVAVVNTKFPEVGKLLLRRIVLQLKRAYKRNDKPQLLAATKFIAHLVNQQVAHEIIALELLTLLLEKPTDDSVEVAVGFVKECGALLQDFSPQGLHGIFERFRGILHEGEIDKRVQFLIEGLFAIRKAKFQGFPAIRPDLDLVEQEDQFTHEVSLEDEIDPETTLDIFRANPQFLEDEKAYEDLKKNILGDDSSNDEEGSEADSEDEDEEESEDDEEAMKIKDETETNLVNLRRTIYLTIMSSVDFEEAGHKLLKIKLEPGQEMELCIMLLECCSQERTYLRYYGLLGQRFCMINKVYQENFEKCFVQQYSMIHRLETNKLRNVAKFFAHLLGTSALPWHVLAYIRLTEEDTTSSSRIFIKILFQELSEHLGIRLLNERLNDPMMQDSFESIFPRDNPKNTRFAINFFTSIGLGGITESLREYLKNMPRLIMQQQKPVPESESESDDSGSPSAASSENSSSETESSSESESDSSSDDRERRGRHSKRRKRN